MAEDYEISLSGSWEFCWLDEGQSASDGWLPATVPGDVHLDLMANGLLNEPLVGMASAESEEIENRVWFYRKSFDFKRPAGEFLARLVFDGLDCVTEVQLNGTSLGKTENAFVPHVFDVTRHLADGENTLLIRLTNGLETVAGRERERYLATDRTFDRIWLRKPQFSFSWDWAPRLITCGIWRGVRLEVTRTGFIDDLYAHTTLSRDSKKATVEYSFGFLPVDAENVAEEAVVEIRDGGLVVDSARIPVGGGPVSGRLTIENPELWWPAGEGDRKLYELEARVGGASRKTLFGVRRIKIVEKPVKEGGKTFYFEVNGRKVFCRGANWVPADSIIARVDDAKIDALLDEAVRCNFNMLRVWGGGIYESRHFYDRCDELGIMIWQDFMYACALYPDDDEAFLQNCAWETESIIKELRNHPCIVVWCGENEIHDGYVDVYQYQGAERLYGQRIWEQVIPDALKRLAKGAIYRPASPYGGKYPRSEMEGDSHCLLAWLSRDQALDIRRAAASVGRFMTEFYTWLSPPNVDSIRRYLSEDQLRAGSEAYVCHANTRYDLQERDIAQRYITADPESLPLEVYVNAVQRLHGEHLAACADQYRRSISICGGALFWMYNDCWPTSSWTTHDYYVRRKALFYYMKRAFAPVNVTFEEEDSGLSVWVSNLTSHEFRGMLRYGRYAFPTGDKSDEWDKKVRVKAGTSARIAFFYTPLAYPWEALGSFGHATLANDAGETISSGSKLFATYKGLSGEEFSMPPSFWAHRSVQLPKIRLERLTADRLVVTTDVPAFSVRVEAEDCLPDDNCFDLMPGECKVVRLERGLPSPDPPVSTLNEVIVFLRDRRL